MSANSKIEWCDHTFNPWFGCKAISPGCKNCYAAALARRTGRDFDTATRTKDWSGPVKWNKRHEAFFAAHGRRQRVFCASVADVFDNAVDPQWRADLFDLILATPNLDWLLLTKRIGNVGNMLPVPFDFDRLYPNVWLGATIVNQEEADRDIPKLLAVPARVRFLSCEPLLGPLDLNYPFGIPTGAGRGSCPMHLAGIAPEGLRVKGQQHLHWVIVGGESGPGARPMHPDWARSLRDQCAAAGVPFLFKQWGEWMPPESSTTSYPAKEWRDVVDATGEARKVAFAGDRVLESSRQVVRVGKKAAGRLLDGVEHNGFPA